MPGMIPMSPRINVLEIMRSLQMVGCERNNSNGNVAVEHVIRVVGTGC